MRKLSVIALMFFLISPLIAQERTGNIYGNVVDNAEDPLPGVAITLTGSLIAPMYTVTSNEGNFRFVSLPPAVDYCVKAEAPGFKPVTQQFCRVSVGSNLNLKIKMELGKLAEQITVTAQVDTVDMKKTSIGRVVTQEILQSLPSARDPWVILQMSPGIQIDRENVGGSESGSQSGFAAAGASSDMNNVWTMDGAVTTDTKSAASVGYFDFDSFEEMTISVGGSDITVQTGGVVVNMITRRGGNKTSLGGRFYLTDNKFQSENLTDQLRKEGVVGTNKIVAIKDYGFNLGGPFLRDKAWYWMAYGVQDIKGFLLNGVNSDSLLTNYNLKLNFQILSQNRFEIHLQGSGKELFGKYAAYSYPKGDHQSNKWHFGNPTIKLQDEHTFGNNFFVSSRYVYVGQGYGMRPIDNENLDLIGLWSVGKQQWIDNRNYTRSGRISPRHDVNLLGNYFNDKLFGVSQEIKFGFEFSNRGNTMDEDYRSYYEIDWNTPQLDYNGDFLPDINADLVKLRNERFPLATTKVIGLTAYLSDTISTGRFNIIAGLRFDKQTPSVSSYPVKTSIVKEGLAWKDNITSETADAINNIFPGFSVPEVKPDYTWEVFSPRLGLTWDVQGNNKTIAKLSFAQYGDYMWTKISDMFNPLGTTGYIDFWWLDDNKNSITDLTELYWHDLNTYIPYKVFDSNGNFLGAFDKMQNLMWGDYDPANPTKTTAPSTTVDKNAGSSRVQEAIVTLEREIIPDFGVSLSLSYRKYDRFNWTLPYFPDTGKIQSQSDFIKAGTVPNNVGGYDTGEAAGRPYYLLSADYGRTSYKIYTRQNDRNNKYYGLTMVFNKRLSHKWMVNGSFSLENQASYFGNKGFVDPTNQWALEGQPYALYATTSGKVGAYAWSSWLLKFSGLYQFPFGINVGATLSARQGYMVPEYFTIRDLNAPNRRYQTTTVYISKFGTKRLPNFLVANMKVEKAINLGETGRIYLTADVFNLFNSAVINRRYDALLGTYYPHDGSFVPNATNFLANEVLNPRVIRFGMRFQF